MYFPEHDGHGDWRLIGLGGFITVGSPRTDDFYHHWYWTYYTAQYAYAEGFAL
jgi:hypothetical protein